MATLIQIADAFDSADVRKQILGAVLALATAIRNEDPATPKHQARLKWARKVTRSARQMSERMHAAIVINGTVNAEIPDITDGAVQNALDALAVKFSDEALPE